MLNLVDQIKWIFERLDKEEKQVRREIDLVCIGYSGKKHWMSYKKIFAQHEQLRDICMLGVYFGRDIAYMSNLMQMMQREYHIVGVDMFDDVPGADWEEELKQEDLSWEEAGFGPAPQIDFASRNLDKLGVHDNVELVKSSMQEYLSTTNKKFDFIYIDVAHDYETTVEAIKLARERLNPGGLLGGDDFSNKGTWGVAKAVKEYCPEHVVHYGWIWCSP